MSSTIEHIELTYNKRKEVLDDILDEMSMIISNTKVTIHAMVIIGNIMEIIRITEKTGITKPSKKKLSDNGYNILLELKKKISNHINRAEKTIQDIESIKDEKVTFPMIFFNEDKLKRLVIKDANNTYREAIKKSLNGKKNYMIHNSDIFNTSENGIFYSLYDIIASYYSDYNDSHESLDLNMNNAFSSLKINLQKIVVQMHDIIETINTALENN